MHKVYKVRDMLCNELEEFGSKEKIDAQSLEVIDKLAHAIKNIDKILDKEEAKEYSNYNPMMRGNSYGGNSYGGRYDDMPYSRGMDMRRDDRYSNDDMYSRENNRMRNRM